MQKKELYLYHLLASMGWQRQNALNQMGKTDIEPENHEEIFEKWYNQLIDLILEKNPEYFVDAVEVYENDDNIIDIDYCYHSEKIVNELQLKNAVINIHWKEL